MSELVPIEPVEPVQPIIPVIPTGPDVVMDDEQVLQYVTQSRVGIIKKLTQNGSKLPEDNAYITLLNQQLDGLSRQALTSKKIKSDEKTSAINAAASAATVAHLLKTMGPTGKNHEGFVPNFSSAPPALPADIPDPVLVPGETEVGAEQLNYKAFMGDAA